MTKLQINERELMVVQVARAIRRYRKEGYECDVATALIASLLLANEQDLAKQLAKGRGISTA